MLFRLQTSKLLERVSSDVMAMLEGTRDRRCVGAGWTTSGCVRATVGDCAQEPHQANLFDRGSKDGDVLPVGDVIRYQNGR
jgi:hypothetical protein